jgi:hypothetical protein
MDHPVDREEGDLRWLVVDLLGGRDELLPSEGLEFLLGGHDVDHAPATFGRSGDVNRPSVRKLSTRKDGGSDPVVLLLASSTAR